jgi:predicted nuclease with TOPRIM domain
MSDNINEMMHEQLSRIQADLDETKKDVRALRESVIRIETHAFTDQLKDVRGQNSELRERLIVLETQGRVFSAGIAAGVSIIVAVIASAISYAMRSSS